jgi:DNA-binding response OmpR family regulator
MTPTWAEKDGKVVKDSPREIRVVACEDQALMRTYIVSGLARLGIRAVGVCDGIELDSHLGSHQADVVILDIGLPGEDGLSIATRLRDEHPHLGIIMLTARDQLDDRVQGMDCGADLYFAKPVDLKELASALRSLHRRLGLGQPLLVARTWRLDSLRSLLITPDRIEVALTDNELRFLTPLLDQPGTVVDREVLSMALGHIFDQYALRRMETLLSRLRAKILQKSPKEPLPVRARHGMGYAFLSGTTESSPKPDDQPAPEQ